MKSNKRIKTPLGTAVVALALSLVSAPTLMAEEPPAVEAVKASAELGFIMTGGNTDTGSLNAKLNYERSIDQLVYSAKYETIKTEENDNETADKFLIETAAKWKMSEMHYFVATLLHEDDQFSAFDFQTTLTLGYGIPIINSAEEQLEASIGPGYRYSKFNADVDGESDDQEWVMRLAGQYNLKLSDSSAFAQNVTFDIGEEQTISKSESSVTAQIATKLAMKAGFSIRHNSDPLEGDASSDRETSITLVYSW